MLAEFIYVGGHYAIVVVFIRHRYATPALRIIIIIILRSGGRTQIS